MRHGAWRSARVRLRVPNRTGCSCAVSPQPNWSTAVATLGSRIELSDNVRYMSEPITVVVEQPFDWTAAILVPVIAVLVSAGIAIWVARIERRSIELDSLRAQAAQLIRALNSMGRAELSEGDEEKNAAYARYEQELNAFAAHLSARQIPVAKFVCLVVAHADRRGSSGDEYRRTLLWLATSVELWVRGALNPRAFEANMPSNSNGDWVDRIDLGQWDAAVRGEPVLGVANLAPQEPI